MFRLKKTWDLLPERGWDIWEELREVFKCDQNFATLRAVNCRCPLPAVPYLGMFLSDLTFIDNESNWVDDEKRLINFVKLQYMTTIIRQIEKYQQGAYCLTPVPILQQYLTQLPILPEKDFYDHSHRCENKQGTQHPVPAPVENKPVGPLTPKTRKSFGRLTFSRPK